ncbi:hypothetical protein, partial [Burkholderia cenocepacia]|uniref:hypothetical protein n=1 Tax=Burkholderia cenocepacia TaxID=95486 RepID=UPI001E36463D
MLARTTNGASLKVRRIVNRAGKRKPTALHDAGSGGFDKECHGRSASEGSARGRWQRRAADDGRA